MSSQSDQRQQRESIETAAAAWVIRLDADSSALLKQQAGDWIDADPRHAVAFAQAQYAWENAGAARQRVDQPAPMLTRRTATAGLLAASLAAAFTLSRSRGADRHSTGRGEQEIAHLADGSSIALNTDTLVEVSLDTAQRRVRLLSGEARFDVARDSKRPFIVDLGDARVQVLGTSFNIRRREDQTELTVTRGLVAVINRNGQTVRVGAGEATLIRPEVLATADLDDALIRQRVAWQDGYIELNDETLEQAVGEFNRYRQGPIVIADPRLASLMVSGRFGIHESRDFLAALSSSFAIHAAAGADGSVALSREPEPKGR